MNYPAIFNDIKRIVKDTPRCDRNPRVFDHGESFEVWAGCPSDACRFIASLRDAGYTANHLVSPYDALRVRVY